MNRRIAAYFFCCLFWSLLAGCPSAVYSQVTETIAAVVNDEVITWAELDIAMTPLRAQLAAQYKDEELARELDSARSEILEQMIEDKLIVQEAKKQKMRADDEEVDEMVGDVQERFSSVDAFEEALALQSMTLESLKERYREQVMARKLVAREVSAKVFVGPSEVEEYYKTHAQEFAEPEAVEVQNILVRTENRSDEEARSRAQMILDDLKKGADFPEAAKKYSEGPNASKGGSLGFVARGQLMKELDEVVFNSGQGQVTDLIKTELGYHILKIGRKRQARTIPLDEVRRNIEETIFKEKAGKRYEEWIKKLKKDAYIAVKIK